MLPHYAIGDVHGRDDLLALLLERIKFEHQQNHADRPGVLVYVGDYIDRGARSREVIDRVMRGVPGFETICLKGNHEHMLLKCVESDDSHQWEVWLGNGGDATAESFNLQLGYGEHDPAALAMAVGSKRLKWLEALKLSYRAGNYFFVHAGIVPGRALEDQIEKDMLWIRDRFLESDQDHGVVVVHGHTPARDPELKSNRIGIDTGPTYWGCLTAVALCEGSEPKFLSVTGEPGKGA
ncbi:MAG: metallophosphoesterase family protein [Micropepsaceae bacterium]